MKTFLLLAGLLAAASAQAEPADPVNGKRLFEASRCLECHATDVFTKETRKVKSFAALESQVRRCDANLSTNWFDDQILDVVAYLNQAFYKFPSPSAGASPASPASPSAAVSAGVNASPNPNSNPTPTPNASAAPATPAAPAPTSPNALAETPTEAPAETHAGAQPDIK